MNGKTSLHVFVFYLFSVLLFCFRFSNVSLKRRDHFTELVNDNNTEDNSDKYTEKCFHVCNDFERFELIAKQISNAKSNSIS